MGILDDAIREHLELKRQHGADSDDLDRLEKEAFGPPTRPGDPEFDTSEGQPAAPAAGAGAEAQPAAPDSDAGLPSTAPPEPASGDAPPAPASAPEPETTIAPETGAAPEPASSGGGFFDVEAAENDEDWLSSLEEVVEQPLVEPEPEASAPAAPDAPEAPGAAPESEAPESTTSPIEDLTPAERARIEHADLGDTVDHPAVPVPETGEEEAAAPLAPETGEEDLEPPVPPPDTGEEDYVAPLPPETGEEDLAPGPPEAPESAIFDQGDEVDFGDLDLDLDEAELDPAPPPPATSTEMDALPPRPVEPVTGEEDEFVADDAAEDELEDEDEDLLEETPDFLQDTPEGERLWFEQGAPKDFDFDDEDEED